MYEAVVMGVSAGGLEALRTVLSALPASFCLPIAIVQHMGEQSDNYLCEFLDKMSAISVKEAEDKEPFSGACAYIAPPGYHLLVEPDRTLSLSVDPRVNYSCPSVDVLFESAAEAFGEALIGVVLTGANHDGALGLKSVKDHGGLAIVQNPATALSACMPRAAMDATKVDHIVEIEQLAPLLIQLHKGD
jgi:two-component system, chemotaxis family, protein-glutamate methylesterase/glutaminase